MLSALTRWLAFSRPPEPIRPQPTPEGFNEFSRQQPFPWPDQASPEGVVGFANDYGRLSTVLHHLGRLDQDVSAFLVTPVLGVSVLPEGSRLIGPGETPASPAIPVSAIPVSDIPAPLRCLPDSEIPIEGRVALVFEWLGWYWTRGLLHWSAFDEVRHHLLTGFFADTEPMACQDFARLRVSAALPRERLERVAIQTGLDAPAENWLAGFVNHLHRTPASVMAFPGDAPVSPPPEKIRPTG
jgi:hypothetical protein